MKQVHTADDQNHGPVVGQNTEDIDVREVPDIIDSQIQDDGTGSQWDDKEDDPDMSEDEEDDPDMPENQISKVLQKDNYCTAIDDDDHDNTI